MAMTLTVLVTLLVGLVFGFGLGRRHGDAAARRELGAPRRGIDASGSDAPW